MNANLKEVFQDKEFVEKLLKTDSKEGVELLKEKGIETTVNDIDGLKDLLVRMKDNKLTDEEKKKISQAQGNAELSDDELENVSGGWGVPWWAYLVSFGGAALVDLGILMYEGEQEMH